MHQTQLVLSLCLSSGLLFSCGVDASEGAEPTSAVHSVQQRLTTVAAGWKSLAAANHNLNFDVDTHLICTADPNPGFTDNVNCYLPNDDYGGSFRRVSTNWGVNEGAASHPIPGGAVKSVALLKRQDIGLSSARPGAAVYEIFVLSADNTVRNTYGESDKFYADGNFKFYGPYIYPTAVDGTSLSFRKIMWMNEDGIENPFVGKRTLFALTYDNKLYRADRSATRWTLHTTGIADMGHAPGRGATFLTTSGLVWYDRFTDDPHDFSGYLPTYPGANITAVGGLWALTDKGKGTDCYPTSTVGEYYCGGDSERILHFSWKKWQWETMQDQVAAAGFPIASNHYYPLAWPTSCATFDGTATCSPQVRTSIVDSSGFGSDNYHVGKPGVWASQSFDLGPFVGRVGSRVYYYFPGTFQPLPGQFHTCYPQWDNNSNHYNTSACANECAQQEDGAYCAANGDRVCSGGTCQACGGLGQPCCVGRRCPGLSGGVCGSDFRCAKP